MTKWLERRAISWLLGRGYWVLKASVPTIVISYGVGTFKNDEHGDTIYTVVMPRGHKLWTLYNSQITRQL